MYRDHTIAVVVPAWNEAESLPELVARIGEAITAMGRTWEVWLIDDGSSDGSRAMLRRLAAEGPGEVDDEFPAEVEMSLVDHLEELRRRILRSLLAVVIGAAIIALDEQLKKRKAKWRAPVLAVAVGIDL